jgi:hypothetical protein
MKIMADDRLDAIAFPHQKRLVVPVGETWTAMAVSVRDWLPCHRRPGRLFFSDSDGPARRPRGYRIPRQALGRERADRDWLRLRTSDQTPPSTGRYAASGGLQPVGARPAELRASSKSIRARSTLE